MQEKIIKILSNSNDYISGQEISTMLGVSRQAIWKTVNSLKEKGYKIESVTNKGYKLVETPSYLNETALKTNLKSKIIGKNLTVLESVTSTNDYLKNLGNNGCESGTLVVSREQTKGKGRLGRVWQTKKDDGIAFSFLLRPKILPSEVSAITPLVGLAVCKAIKSYTNIDCMIKWPNDIIVGNKKLVGILTEMSAEFDGVEYIVAGIGINVDNNSFSEEISYKATSILLETGKHIDKNEFLAEVIYFIENELIKNDLKLTYTSLEEYKNFCATIGREVTFNTKNGKTTGKAIGIEANGELRVLTADNTTYIVNSGEVTVQGIY